VQPLADEKHTESSGLVQVLTMRSLRAVPLSDGHVQVPRTADVVADRIRELIVTGQLADGERLPGLDGLLDEFGISGPTMREALRMLESEGLITVQRGKLGGAIVHRPSYATAASTMALVLRSHDTQIADVARSLAVLERECAVLCARRPDRERTVVPTLRELNERARGLVHAEELTFTEAMSAYHEELMRGCGLATLALATRAVGAIWLVSVRQWAANNGSQGTFVTHEERVAWLDRQTRLIELIEAGDEAGVEEMMTVYFSTLQILGEGLDPEQMVDVRAVRANRITARARYVG
jgi:GntR family transcriptional regulator, transcriptional repressor for pyruvate dehydrogenase complex